MNKGKHVYCEKPMVHKLEEGAEVIETQKKTGKVMQIGSQRVSSIVTKRRGKFLNLGLLGNLFGGNLEGSPRPKGAWQYSIPTDANAGTVDWENSMGDAPKVAYDPFVFSGGEITRIMEQESLAIFSFTCFQDCIP